MMTFQSLLEKAKDFGGYEILLTSDSQPRIRRGKEWSHLVEEKMRTSDLRKLCLSILNSEQKEQLSQSRAVKAFWHLQGQKFYFEIFPSDEGLTAHFRFRPSEWVHSQFWNFPKWIGESLVRAPGLFMVASPDSLALDSAIESLLMQISQNSKKWIVWQRAQNLSQLQSTDQSVISYLSSVPEACDVVVLEDFSQISLALDLAEQGKTVIWALKALDLRATLSRCGEMASSARLANHLKMAMSLKVILGLESWVPAYDLVANTPTVQEMIEQKNWSLWAKVFDSGASKDFGMRSFNQSLLQLILKRKIDFKSGFTESPAPQDLDQLMKKVGV